MATKIEIMKDCFEVFDKCGLPEFKGPFVKCEDSFYVARKLAELLDRIDKLEKDRDALVSMLDKTLDYRTVEGRGIPVEICMQCGEVTHSGYCCVHCGYDSGLKPDSTPDQGRILNKEKNNESNMGSK